MLRLMRDEIVSTCECNGRVVALSLDGERDEHGDRLLQEGDSIILFCLPDWDTGCGWYAQFTLMEV